MAFYIVMTTLTTIASWYQSNHKMLSIGVGIIVGFLFFLYVFVPLMFHLCPYIQKHIVFQFCVNVPSNINYNSPTSVGIKGGRNVYIQSEANVSIGVWHILPQSALPDAGEDPNITKSELSECYWEGALKTVGKGIILYLHGNTGTRALAHRVELYKIFQREDFHVFTLDYRSYGDSSPSSPNETGVVTDAKAVYNWILSLTGQDSNLPIFVWGHSLGTGVSLSMIASLGKKSFSETTTTTVSPPTEFRPNTLSGLFLEAPFSSFSDAVQNHRLTLPYRFMPGFQSIFVSPLLKNDIAFENHRHIQKLTIPILILHAVDDKTIPYSLGRKLYNAGKEFRSETAKPIYFKRFGNGYAHKFIHKSPELPVLLNEFVNCCIFDDWPCYSLHSDVGAYDYFDETS